MASRADIRRTARAANRALKEYERTNRRARADLGRFDNELTRIKAVKIRETQKVGRELSRQLFTRFGAQLFANADGDVQWLGKFSKAWGERKKQLKLRPERGQARRGIYKQLRSPLIFAKLPDGFDIDIKRPALWVTGRASLGKREASLIRNSRKSKNILGNVVKTLVTNRQSFYVNAYIDAYADAKAPGLGGLAKEDLAELESRANAAVMEKLKLIRGASRARLGNRAAVLLAIKIGKAG